MSFNFKDVDVPAENLSYIKPGFWKMAPVQADLVAVEGKNPYISIIFEGKEGKLVDKFYLSEKAMVRLQYLHTELYEKKIEKDFASASDIATYFNTLFTKKKVELSVVVGGEESSDGTKVYAKLPFLNFVIKDEDFTEGAFEPDSPRYKSVVKKNTFQSTGAPKSNDTVVKSSDDDIMPWD